MRRASALIVVPMLAALAAVGCSSSPPSSSAPSSAVNESVTATGSFGSAPKVSIPAEKAGTNLAVKTVIKGTGAPLTTTDNFVADQVVYVWSGTSHKILSNSFTSGPAVFTGIGKLIPGLKDALDGKTVGSRVVAVIPPKDAFGTSGNSSIGVKGSDTLVFIVDVVRTFGSAASGSQVSSGGGTLPTVSSSATNPTITIPKNNPPAALTTRTIIKGSGPVVQKGQTLAVQYTGIIWRTGQKFDSSWSRSQPFTFVMDTSQMIPGWVNGLVGQTVGSRVMLVIPPKDGYGSTGNSQAGIKGTDTLVFAVDILEAVSPPK